MRNFDCLTENNENEKDLIFVLFGVCLVYIYYIFKYWKPFSFTHLMAGLVE